MKQTLLKIIGLSCGFIVSACAHNTPQDVTPRIPASAGSKCAYGANGPVDTDFAKILEDGSVQDLLKAVRSADARDSVLSVSVQYRSRADSMPPMDEYLLSAATAAGKKCGIPLYVQCGNVHVHENTTCPN